MARKSPFGPGRPSRQEPPNAPGVYRWRDKETGLIQDIGEGNLKARKSAREYPTDQYSFEWKKADGRSSSNTRRAVEKKQIDKHNNFKKQAHILKSCFLSPSCLCFLVVG